MFKEPKEKIEEVVQIMVGETPTIREVVQMFEVPKEKFEEVV